MLKLLDKVMLHPKTPRTAARTLERIVRAGKSVRVSRDRSRRRELVSAIPRKPELERILDPVRGFGWIPKGTLKGVPAAIKFAQRVLEERRQLERANKDNKAGAKDYLIHLCEPTRYEEAPALYELALSDEVLQIATQYLGEVPVLLRVQVLWSPVNSGMRGSQLYHRDGRKWLQRRVKFIFAATDIEDSSGPFTFLPADVSERMSDDFEQFKMQDRVTDEDMYRFINPADEMKFVGRPESGLVIDSSRCFHFGSRARGQERLLLMFQFWSPLDLPPGQGINLRRSPLYLERFGDDPVRMLLIPDDDTICASATLDTD